MPSTCRWRGLEGLSYADVDTPRRHAIVLLSDGQDTSSKQQIETMLLDLANRSNTAIYAVGSALENATREAASPHSRRSPPCGGWPSRPADGPSSRPTWCSCTASTRRNPPGPGEPIHNRLRVDQQSTRRPMAQRHRAAGAARPRRAHRTEGISRRASVTAAVRHGSRPGAAAFRRGHGRDCAENRFASPNGPRGTAEQRGHFPAQRPHRLQRHGVHFGRRGSCEHECGADDIPVPASPRTRPSFDTRTLPRTTSAMPLAGIPVLNQPLAGETVVVHDPTLTSCTTLRGGRCANASPRTSSSSGVSATGRRSR